jgi:hypothetical protein
MFSGSVVFHGYRSFKCCVVRFPATKNTDLLTGSMSAKHAGRTVLATERQVQVERNKANVAVAVVMKNSVFSGV